jgi:predicted ATPase
VTLTGTGGVGKTRLALHVAEALMSAFPDGAFVAELAALADPDLVPLTVATALGLRQQSTRPLPDLLVEHLEQRTVLLVLDNCEHVVDACAQLADAVLPLCPRVRILATSRTALSVDGERLFEVPPLSVTDRRSADLLPDAVQLLVDRVRLVRPVGFQKSAWAFDLQRCMIATVSLRLLYLIFSQLLSWLTLLPRAPSSKDIELLVLSGQLYDGH